jgi:Ser/Thr protein kinase RdoA (MazF antagonist)
MSGAPLDPLAAAALAHYPIMVVGCRRLPQTFNVLFAVDAVDGSRYALRISAPERIHPDEVEQVEVAWLAELAAESVVPVPPVVATINGSRWVEVTTPGSGERRIAVLFGWVEGVSLEERMSRDALLRSGELSALLHARGVDRGAPSADVPVADRIVYWRLTSDFGELVPMYGTLFDEAAERAQATIDRLWREPPNAPHLLHGDFIPQNLIADGERLTVIDFQDCFWGFEAQDIAITVTALRRFAETADLERMFRAGYERMRPWPIGDTEELEALVAARRLHLVALALTMRREGFAESAARNAGPLASWLRSG